MSRLTDYRNLVENINEIPVKSRADFKDLVVPIALLEITKSLAIIADKIGGLDNGQQNNTN